MPIIGSYIKECNQMGTTAVFKISIMVSKKRIARIRGKRIFIYMEIVYNKPIVSCKTTLSGKEKQKIHPLPRWFFCCKQL